jgi:mannose-6-phosphate isomerase-like protein (cupin superfamily)
VVAKVNLEEALERMGPEHWRPRVIADFNDAKVQLSKFEGDFVWHKHDETDDFFLVLSGRLLLDLPDGTIELGAGELIVVPRGVEHRPRAAGGEVHVLNLELAGTVNTGDAEDAGALTAPEQRL